MVITMSSTLTSTTLARAALTNADIQAMFSVFCENFDGAALDIFERDLQNKNWVILLRDAATLTLQGFSTLSLYETRHDGKPISVVYSGDTIIRPAYWGTPELPTAWIKTVLEKSANM